MIDVAAGAAHSCVVVQSGKVLCWGDNAWAQLGKMPSANDLQCDGRSCRVEPLEVPGINDAVRISAGMWHTCVARQGGTVACWGRNGLGQLGHVAAGDPKCTVGADNEACNPVPTTVLGLSDVVTELASGAVNSCALTSVHNVYCWGYGDYKINPGADWQVANSIAGLKAAGNGWEAGIVSLVCNPTPAALSIDP